MSRVSVVGKITAQPGKRDEVMAALGPMLEAVEKEAGTLLYVFNTDRKDDDVLWIYELYEDREALQAHAGSEAMKANTIALGGLLAGPPELHIGQPLAGKGLPAG